MKYCQKPNCEYPAIHRGKFCENHRTKKRKIENNISTNNILNTADVNTKYEEKENITEILKKQNEEYEFCMNEDLKRLCKISEEKELNDILELSKETFIDDLKKQILHEPDIESKNNYIIQFKLPSGLNIKRKFYEDVTFKDIRNFLNFYFHENKINILNYNLVIFPKKIFTFENNEKLLDYDIGKNITFFINNCDA